MKLHFYVFFVTGTALFAQIGPNSQSNAKASGSLDVVADCGAKGNGSVDDSGAIQACISRAGSGQTVYFPNGTYNLSGTLYPHGGTTLSGESTQAVLHANNMGNWILMFPWSGANDITLSTLTFDQGGVDTNGNGQTPNNIHITNCKFQNVTQAGGNWTQENFIFMDNGLSNSRIDHNSFYMLLANGSTRVNGNVDYDGDIARSAISGSGLDNTSIDHNTFDHVYQGIKLCQVLPYQTQNAYIGYNVMTNIHRMGMEIQDSSGCGRGSGPSINSQDFLIENNSLLSWIDYYWSSFGISFANVFADHSIVRNNLITAPPYNAGWRGIGIEIGGRPAQVYGNVLAGPWGEAIGVFGGSTGSEVHDNFACSVNTGNQPTIQDEHSSPTGTYYYSNTTVSSCPSSLPSAGAQ